MFRLLEPTNRPPFAQAFQAIEAVRTAGLDLTHAVATEAELLRMKPLEKQSAIRRLMAEQNPLVPGKAHTCTSAEAVVGQDPAYREFCQQVTAATVGVELARTALICARLVAQLELARVLDGSDHGNDAA
jgi:hypothetical protein